MDSKHSICDEDIQLDDLNKLFLSNDIKNLFKFFDCFSGIMDLVNWMKERPKQMPQIIVNDSNSDIVVVVPTRDVNSKFALNCRDNIFKGITKIFVESKKPTDPFFNFSFSVNEGVKEAMKMKPKWIIISNDDMYKIDSPEVLLSELSSLDHTCLNSVFTNPLGDYHSYRRMLATPNKLYSIITNVHPNRLRKKRMNLWNKFDIHYIDALYGGPSGLMSKLTYTNKILHLLTGSFFIISSTFAESRKNMILDDTFINGGEDTDLSLRLSDNLSKIGFIKYRIGDIIGGSLGNNWIRITRNVVNEAYLNYKIAKGILNVKESKK